MDRRNWPWRKRSSEKVSGMAEQGETMPAPLPAPAIISSPSPAPTPAHEEQGLEEKVKTINSQLSAALVESKAKDDLVKQHAKVAEEAVSGWEKAEAEAVSMKEERDVALQQKVAAEDRVCHLDGALKECMRQLRQVREEHEQKIHDVVMKKANELDRIRTELEEQLAGINHQLLEAAAENTVLRKSLQEKTQIIEQLSERKTYVEADFKVLQVKLNSLEKENSALRYELHVLNKELEIRNEEKEYNRRSTDAANKQFIESTKKIAKLETECQRLRVLVRKKLPGPAAIAQMKMEVEMLGKDAVEGKRKRMGKGAGLTSLAGESMHDNAQENSFKTAETAKVKFFPSHSVAGLRSGVPLKASSKSNAADENSNIASPRTGMVNSRPFSPKNISSTVTDSSGPPVNRSGLQSFSRQTIVNSGSRSVGLSNSNDALPSFLLSSRSNNSSRVNSIFRSSTEAGSGNGAGPLSGTKGNMKSNSSRISFPASSSYLKDSQNLTSRNSEVKGILKQSAGKFLVDESRDEKSDADYSAFSSIPRQGNCKLDESTPPFKGNSPLTLESAEQKPSTVVAKVLQPQKLASVELKGSAMAIEIPKGLMLTKKVVKDNASTECLNLSESVKEDPDGINLKQMEGGLNTCELSHKDNTKQLPVSALAEGDIGGSTLSNPPTSMPVLTADTEGSSSLKDKLHEDEKLSLIKESEALTFGKDEHKSLDPTNVEHNVTVSVGEDPKLTTSSKSIFLVSSDNQPNVGNPLKTSADMLVDKASRLKSIPESLVDNLHLVEASQKGDTLQTMTNIVPEMVSMTKNSRKEVKSTLPAKDNGSSDTSINISNDMTGKPINGSSKDLSSLEESIVKPTLPASVAQASAREVSVETQAEICMNKPLEKYESSLALMQNHTFGPSEMTSLSVSVSKDIATLATLNGGSGFPQKKQLTRPASESFWRGGFKIIDRVIGCKFYDGIQAYLANKASPKVYEVSRKFPPQLQLEQVQRCSAWPKRFKVTPPTDGDIAVFIFPTEIKRCQSAYFELLEVMIKQDLALRVYLEGAELLIFSSNHLPENYQRFSGQMYLWGVFRSGIASADPQRSFPYSNNVGSKVLLSAPSSQLAKNNDMLPMQQTCMDNRGCSEGEEDMDVDMEGGREIGMAERPAPRPISHLAHVIVNNASQPSFPSSSKPIVSHYENSKLVLPPVSELPPGFDHSPGISRNSSGKSTEAMLENSSIFRPHEKLQEREITPGFRLPEGKELPNKNMLSGSFSQGWNCLPSTGLELMVFPPGLQPAPVKFLPSYRNFQPVFGHATRNPPHVALNHLPCTQHATLKSPPSLPGFKATFSNQILFSSDHLPGIKPTSAKPHLNLSDCRPGFQPSLKHPVSSSDCPPGTEPAAVTSPMTSSERPAGVEHASWNCPFSSSGHQVAVEPDAMKLPVSYSEYPPGFEPASGNHSLPSSYRLPGSEPTAKKPLLSSIQCSSCFHPDSGNRSLHSSDCPPSLKLAADKSLPPSSVYPVKCPLSEQLQDSVVNGKFDLQPEVHYEIQPSRQRSTYLSSREDDSSRSHIKAEHAYESREFKCSHSLASIHRPLSYSDHPPAVEPVAMKHPLSISEYPPGCEPAFGNYPLSSSDRPAGSEPAAEKRSLSSTQCSPSFETVSGNNVFSSSDSLPSFEFAAKNSVLPTSVHPLKHLVSVPLQDSVGKDKVNFKPEVQHEIQPSRQRSAYLSSREDDSRSHIKEDHAYESREFKCFRSCASIHPPLSSSDHPPTTEPVAMKPTPSISEYPPGCEPAFGNHSLPSSDHPTGSEPAAEKHPLSSTQCSRSFKPASENHSLSSSDCPPGFKLAAENSLPSSSVHALEHLESVQVQDSVMKDKLDAQPEVRYDIQPSRQCSAYFSSREDDSSRSHTNADHAHESREFKCSYSVASICCPLSSSDHPTAAEPVAMKSPLSSSEYPPGFEPSFGKHSLPFSDYPPGNEPTGEKHRLSSTQTSPGSEHASGIPSLAPSDYPTSFELTAEKSLLPSLVHSVEHLVSEHLQDKNDLEPEVQNEIRTGKLCAGYFPTREDDSRSYLKTDHAHGRRKFNQSCSFSPINHPISSSDHPPVEDAAMKPPRCNSQYPLVSGNHSLASSDSPANFELAAERSLQPSSVCTLKHLVSEQFQDQHDPELEFQNEIKQRRQHSPYLSSTKDGSRNHLKRDHAYRSSEFKRSRSLASMNTDVHRTRNSPWMCKSKSFKEELYNNSSRRRKEDRREGDTHRYREKGDGREGDKYSKRDKESRRERGRSSSREMGDARKKARSNNRETESKRDRGRSCSREKEDTREQGRNNSREKQDMRKGDREYAERENGRARDSGHHRHHSRYSGNMRHKEHEKHSSSFSYCNSHSESTTQSYSPSRENGKKEATENLLSHQQVKSFNLDSSIVHYRNKKPSLDKDSESGENDITDTLYKANAPLNDDHDRSCYGENYSSQLMKSEICSLEVKKKVSKIKSKETSAADDHAPLWDLNNEATCSPKFSDENSCGEATCQVPIQANISDPMNSRNANASRVGEYVIPEMRKWCAGSSSMLASANSPKCLQLFPFEDGDSGQGECTVNDWDFNLEQGNGQWTLNRETLPLFEQSSLQKHPCNFMLDDGASTSRSMSIYDDSRDGSSTVLSLSMPQYRKQGNTWVEVTKDIEQSDQNDAAVKLTLSLFS